VNSKMNSYDKLLLHSLFWGIYGSSSSMNASFENAAAAHFHDLFENGNAFIFLTSLPLEYWCLHRCWLTCKYALTYSLMHY